MEVDTTEMQQEKIEFAHIPGDMQQNDLLISINIESIR